eukprot:CAMPEP_0206271102 /NCGR_PEP_ID=MMETSP0047_2-20121206/33243_1 /ASSEMBLY_ACC=CAM_ASM_000192 /TAXON_ID=195065 /ORGANISM="Chroomonas mesostigmatica_cf, Strain CCMP1168" /LENGTH=63 /DNA_ID=CAMNT_0053699829 /DNA_START=54 /DNA_END=241 /DNA_ORIENTATION=+
MAAAAVAVLTMYHGLKPESVQDSSVPMGSGAMFDRVAPQYDLVNTVLTMKMDARWRNRMIDSL